MLNLAHENIPSTSLYRGLRGCNGGEKRREQFVIIPHAMHKICKHAENTKSTCLGHDIRGPIHFAGL